ncbi:MAG: DUF1552 domain-containing protein [Myxococcota bacterium]
MRNTASGRWPRFSRRGLLASIGAGAALAPFVPLLESDAQAPSAKKRVVFLHSPNGCIDRDTWSPSGTGTGAVLSDMFEPLMAHASQITVVSGTGHTSAYDAALARKAHLGNPGTVLTGQINVNYSDPVPQGPSLDQVLAQQLGAETSFPSVHYSVLSHPRARRYVLSYLPNGDMVVPEHNPEAAFRRLFADLPDGNETQMVDPFEDRRSVMDAVVADLNALSSRVGYRDRLKLDAHLTAVRDIEMTLARRRAVVCEAPPQRTGTTTSEGEANALPETSKAYMDMLAAAFACDLTRIATMQWSIWRVVLRFIGVNADHHSLSHEGGAGFASALTWMYSEIAYLMDRLAEMPDGDGTLLDNTLLVWCSEMERGRGHSARNLPFFLAGGGGFVPWELGSHVAVTREACHSELLTSVGQVMGLETDVFGDPRFADGPLRELA